MVDGHVRARILESAFDGRPLDVLSDDDYAERRAGWYFVGDALVRLFPGG